MKQPSRMRAVLGGIATGVVMGLVLFLIWKAVARRDAVVQGGREKSLPAASPGPRKGGTQVARLRAWLADHPGQAIPEMRLVSPDGWARASAAIDFDSPTSVLKAVRALRGQGRQVFGQQLASALFEFSEANEGALPYDLEVLRPYLPPTCGETMLRRYAVLAHGRYDEAGDETPLVGEIAGVDDEFDSVLTVSKRMLVKLNADRSGAEIQRAIHRYVQANEGAAPQSAPALASYLTIPVADSDIRKYFNKGGIEISIKN